MRHDELRELITAHENCTIQAARDHIAKAIRVLVNAEFTDGQSIRDRIIEVYNEGAGRHFIAAIREYRSLTEASLKDAKHKVEEITGHKPIDPKISISLQEFQSLDQGVACKPDNIRLGQAYMIELYKLSPAIYNLVIAKGLDCFHEDDKYAAVRLFVHDFIK